jgi:hypothetical protein
VADVPSRLLTAVAVGALVVEGLDELSTDDSPTPALCFEWLVVEALVRRTLEPGAGRRADALNGVPGVTAARAVMKRGERLQVANYLSKPGESGYTGVFTPLARSLGVVDHYEVPGLGAHSLVHAWEKENDLVGFADETPSTAGGRLRSSLLEAVVESQRMGKCAPAPSWSHWSTLARTLSPDNGGPEERFALRTLVLDQDHGVRSELARALDKLPLPRSPSELEILQHVRQRCSDELGRHIDMVIAYEKVAVLLDTAFWTMCHLSTLLGSRPLAALHINNADVLIEISSRLPDACSRMREVVEQSDESLAVFEQPMSPAQMADHVLAHHEVVQRARSRDRNSWFDAHGDGWTIRPQYRHTRAATLDDVFVNSYGVAALWRFMNDTRPVAAS